MSLNRVLIALLPLAFVAVSFAFTWFTPLFEANSRANLIGALGVALGVLLYSLGFKLTPIKWNSAIPGCIILPVAGVLMSIYGEYAAGLTPITASYAYVLLAISVILTLIMIISTSRSPLQPVE